MKLQNRGEVLELTDSSYHLFLGINRLVGTLIQDTCIRRKYFVNIQNDDKIAYFIGVTGVLLNTGTHLLHCNRGCAKKLL